MPSHLVAHATGDACDEQNRKAADDRARESPAKRRIRAEHRLAYCDQPLAQRGMRHEATVAAGAAWCGGAVMNVDLDAVMQQTARVGRVIRLVEDLRAWPGNPPQAHEQRDTGDHERQGPAPPAICRQWANESSPDAGECFVCGRAAGLDRDVRHAGHRRLTGCLSWWLQRRSATLPTRPTD